MVKYMSSIIQCKYQNKNGKILTDNNIEERYQWITGTTYGHFMTETIVQNVHSTFLFAIGNIKHVNAYADATMISSVVTSHDHQQVSNWPNELSLPLLGWIWNMSTDCFRYVIQKKSPLSLNTIQLAKDSQTIDYVPLALAYLVNSRSLVHCLRLRHKSKHVDS